MNKVKKVLYGALATVMLFSLVSCDMIEKTPEAKAKEVIAKVKDEEITRGDIDENIDGYYKMAEQQYGENYKDNAQVMEIIKQQQKNALEVLIQKAVLVQKGNELGLFKDEEIQKTSEEKLAEIKDQIEKQGTTYEDYLKNYNITEEDFMNQIKDNAKMEIVIDYVGKDEAVSDEEVKKYYDDNVDTYKKVAGTSVSHILVNDENEANEILKQLNNGADFAQLAIDKSQDSSASQGGLLQDDYDPAKSTFVEEFNKGIEEIKNGGISPKPVKSKFGYHIIKVDVRKEEATVPFEEVKAVIKNNLLYQKKSVKFEETYKQWEDELGVKRYEDKL